MSDQIRRSLAALPCDCYECEMRRQWEHTKRDLDIISPKRKALGDILLQGMPNSSTGLYDVKSTIDRLETHIKQSNLALLSRIEKEVIGKDEYVMSIDALMDPASGTGVIVQAHRSQAANELRAKQRTKLDNIAKEIRGEGHE